MRHALGVLSNTVVSYTYYLDQDNDIIYYNKKHTVRDPIEIQIITRIFSIIVYYNRVD
jgi:hypothetical protein